MMSICHLCEVPLPLRDSDENKKLIARHMLVCARRYLDSQGETSAPAAAAAVDTSAAAVPSWRSAAPTDIDGHRRHPSASTSVARTALSVSAAPSTAACSVANASAAASVAPFGPWEDDGAAKQQQALRDSHETATQQHTSKDFVRNIAGGGIFFEASASASRSSNREEDKVFRGRWLAPKATVGSQERDVAERDVSEPLACEDASPSPSPRQVISGTVSRSLFAGGAPPPPQMPHRQPALATVLPKSSTITGNNVGRFSTSSAKPLSRSPTASSRTGAIATGNRLLLSSTTTATSSINSIAQPMQFFSSSAKSPRQATPTASTSAAAASAAAAAVARYRSPTASSSSAATGKRLLARIDSQTSSVASGVHTTKTQRVSSPTTTKRPLTPIAGSAAAVVSRPSSAALRTLTTNKH